MPARDPVEYDLSWVRDRRLTLDEVAQYKRIGTLPPCLVCGRKLRTLSGHIRTHGMTIKEYREFYGIPRFMKLTDHRTRELKSDISRELIKDGVIGIKHDSKECCHEYMKKIRSFPKVLTRPEIRSFLATENCKKINNKHDGNEVRRRKMASTHTSEETRKIRSLANIERSGHVALIEAWSERRWVKSPEHEARRQEVLQERTGIIRTTPPHLLDGALAEFKARCVAERKRRAREKQAERRRAARGN